MSTIATTANGLWSATGTWSGAALPGPADTAQVDHQVTLDMDDVVAVLTGSGSILADPDNDYTLLVGNPKPSWIVRGIGQR